MPPLWRARSALRRGVRAVVKRAVGFGRRSFILGAGVAGERHPIYGKASMIVWLRNGSLHSGNSAPSLAGLFVFRILVDCPHVGSSALDAIRIVRRRGTLRGSQWI